MSIGTQAKEAVRWNIKVSRETDSNLRDLLGTRGMKKGDLSAFVEKAVRDLVFRSTVEDIKNRNADTAPDELQALIDETVREVRNERYARRRK